MSVVSIFGSIAKFISAMLVFLVTYIAGARFVDGYLPEAIAEPGLLSPDIAVLLIGFLNVALVAALIKSSRWTGLKLMLWLSLAYYGAVTFIMQIETAYFLTNLTVDAALLPRLFLMGIPTAFVFIPFSVLLFGNKKFSKRQTRQSVLINHHKVGFEKIAAIICCYLTLYWCAGYYIAWQNPELRAFYGSPGVVQDFWPHTFAYLSSHPTLIPFQMLRAVLWLLVAYPIIVGSRFKTWQTALLVGAFLSIPQNIGHIFANPLIPNASVRLSHMVETASSTFAFGVLIVIILQRRGLRNAVIDGNEYGSDVQDDDTTRGNPCNLN